MSNHREQWSEGSYSTHGNGAAASSAGAGALAAGASGWGDFSWIHSLARGEQNPEADRLLQAASGGLDPQQRIEEATVDFLTRIREQFTEFCRIFNGYSEAGSRFQEIKVYSVAQTAADFMIYRNQVKLVVSNAAHGVIQISFSHHQRAGAPTDPASAAQDLLAQVGPFGDVTWTYQGERIQPVQVARFYFTEFVRATRDQRKSRSGSQQLLLEQIKALLQEQGLHL
ncbi:MAG: hypothetical protein RJB38_2364 [Pseudomonadota bacterium]|jgi:hypothetical protein